MVRNCDCLNSDGVLISRVFLEVFDQSTDPNKVDGTRLICREYYFNDRFDLQ